jgi:hypothetical protein
MKYPARPAGPALQLLVPVTQDVMFPSTIYIHEAIAEDTPLRSLECCAFPFANRPPDGLCTSIVQACVRHSSGKPEVSFHLSPC